MQQLCNLKLCNPSFLLLFAFPSSLPRQRKAISLLWIWEEVTSGSFASRWATRRNRPFRWRARSTTRQRTSFTAAEQEWVDFESPGTQTQFPVSSFWDALTFSLRSPPPAVRPCGGVPRRLHGETRHQRQEAPSWFYLLLPLPTKQTGWGKHLFKGVKFATDMRRRMLCILSSKWNLI